MRKGQLVRWMVRLAPAATILLSVSFAAHAANQALVTHALMPAERNDPMATLRVGREVRAVQPARGAEDVRDADAVAERNVFCSDCAPVEPPPPSPPPSASPAAATPPLTTLPLELLAITVAQGRRYAFASIAATDARWSGAYYQGDEIPGAGPVVAVGGRFVDFHNRSSGRIERLDVLGVPLQIEVRAPEKTKDAFAAELEASIKKLDDGHYEVSRAFIDKLLADPSLVANAAKLRPTGGGQPGFKVFAVRADSAAARLGLKNGDTLTAVNGYELGTNYDKLLELYTKLKSSQSVSLQVTRAGQTVTLTYAIK